VSPRCVAWAGISAANDGFLPFDGVAGRVCVWPSGAATAAVDSAGGVDIPVIVQDRAGFSIGGVFRDRVNVGGIGGFDLMPLRFALVSVLLFR